MAVPIASGGFDQLFDLSFGEVLSAAELAVRLPPRDNCSFLDGWRDQLQARFGHGFRLLAINDCSYNTHFTSSVRGNLAMMVSGFYRLPVVIRSAEAGVSSRTASLHDGHALGKRHVFGGQSGRQPRWQDHQNQPGRVPNEPASARSA
jgi:hypothetical protein